MSERSLVNVYCFSLFFGENVEQAKEMPMDLKKVDTISIFACHPIVPILTDDLRSGCVML